MFKKLNLIILIFIIFATKSFANFDVKAKTAIIQDYHSGEILFEKEADLSIYPASMTKIMTSIIAFDLIKAGDLSLDDKFLISEKAWRLSTAGFSSMFVMVGDEVSVEDLLMGIIVASGNDACIALAEGIAGTEEEFAIMIANSSSVPAIPSASAIQASLPDATIIPIKRSSTETSSPTITNIEENPAVDNLHAFSEIKNLSSKLKSPALIKSKAIIEVIILVIDAG